MRITELVLGGPGAGKTEALLRLVETQLERGVPPEAIAFVAFTRAAAREARERAQERFGLEAKRLPWFRTLHSLAFEALGLRREEVMQRSHWKELGDLLGLKFGRDPIAAVEGLLMPTDREGDQGRYLLQLARATGRSLREIWRAYGAGIGWERLEQLERTLEGFKRDLAVVDFSDMLRLFLERGSPVGVQVAFIDEAQDLTTEQWRAVELAFRDTPHVYVAGDDDQAIYKWSGSDLGKFLTLDAPRRVLPVSHRLSKTVFRYAQQIVNRLSGRYDKDWRSTDREGAIHFLGDPDLVDLSVKGDWLLLARHRYQLPRLGAIARAQGVPYSVSGTSAVDAETVTAIRAWETMRHGKPIPVTFAESLAGYLGTTCYASSSDGLLEKENLRLYGWPVEKFWHDAFVALPQVEREFYRSCLRRGEDLIAAPRVRVSTIHGAKGAEADHVLVLPDLSHRTWAAFQTAPDPEHRVFYVGVTRARETLHLVYPSTSKSYVWPELVPYKK